MNIFQRNFKFNVKKILYEKKNLYEFKQFNNQRY